MMDFAFWALIYLLTIVILSLIFQVVLHLQNREAERRMAECEANAQQKLDEWVAHAMDPERRYNERRRELEAIRQAKVDEWQTLGRTVLDYGEDLEALDKFHEDYLRSFHNHLYQ